MESLLSPIFAIVAILYAAVGQAGGTGYIAVMGLIGFASDVIKPTALALNILVAAIGCARFYRAGLLTWRTCYPFAILGAPFSLLSGVHLPASIYQPVVGVLLLVAAFQMISSARFAELQDQTAPHQPPFMASMLAGGIVGFVSGITGSAAGYFSLRWSYRSAGWKLVRRLRSPQPSICSTQRPGLRGLGRRCLHCPRRYHGGSRPLDWGRS